MQDNLSLKNIPWYQKIYQKIISLLNKGGAFVKFLWQNHFKKFLLGLLAFLIIIWVLFFRSGSHNAGDQVAVTVGDITDQVVLSGRTESLQDVNLGFADSGRVSHVYVHEGDRVQKGQTLAQLEMGDLSAQYQGARAGVVIAEANLKQAASNVDRVTREQDALVAAAKRNLYGNLEAYPEDIFSAFTAPKVYGSYQGDIEGIYKLDLYSSNASTGISVNYSGLETGTTSLTIDNRVALGGQGLFIQFPSNAGYANTKWVIPIPNNRSSSYASLKSAYETALATRDRAIENARADVSGDMASVMQARLDQARASLAQIASAMTRRKIVAPFTGTISKVSLKEGESTIGTAKDVSPGISMLATDQYKVVIKIPEIDVARVKAPTPVAITLDAYGPDALFEGTLISINPAETLVDGVPVYEGTVLFSNHDDRIRSGMTATVRIILGEKKGILILPASALREDKVKRKFFVQVVNSADADTTTEREVTTGIRGSDGMVEIMSGVVAGDLVIKG
jgi:HlyD family secretion protein